eukprot:NODE_4515_length_466_cov_14.350120_g3889_i0.p4 GENE.NODE_4515_length_466_cov_14.350120_g3889_i0~~NODE_4515_length_466_cov_14.350120_g3889_i0.p4  ORF type:complete len:55 (+),score=10.64 NODE_4515_length_466_cov_14.350120_g3889_i0:169-333(+)
MPTSVAIVHTCLTVCVCPNMAVSGASACLCSAHTSDALEPAPSTTLSLEWGQSQ